MGEDRQKLKMNDIHFWKSFRGFTINSLNHLTLNDIDLMELAPLSNRPIYILNELAIRENLQAYKKALALYYPYQSSVFYASKSFLNLGICYLLQQEGIGLDVCSEGEFFIAQQTNHLPAHMIFHGNNKSSHELALAIQSQIRSIIVDNEDEYNKIEQIAGEQKIKANVMFRINPMVEIETHRYIATGVKGTKFGLSLEEPHTLNLIQKAAKNPNINLKGLHFHIGSQILKLTPYMSSIEKVINYIKMLKDHQVEIKELNIGGGLGISYKDSDTPLNITHFVQEVAQKIVSECTQQGVDLPMLMVEPGRSILGAAGCTLYKIGFIKEEQPNFFLAAINGGMSDNIRPSLYQAQYTAVIANKMNWDGPYGDYKIVGKCCETGDVLIDHIKLPQCEEGDVLVMFSTGSYQHALASNYNKHTLPGVLLVGNGRYDWITKEQSMQDLIQNDVIPNYLLPG